MKITLSMITLAVLCIVFAAGLSACGNSSDLPVMSTVTQPGISVTPSSGLVTSESAVTNTIDVTLASAPTGDVTIEVASLDPTEVLASPSFLTFTSTDWDVPQTVTLTGLNDDLLDGNQTVSVTLDPSGSADAVYALVSVVTLEVINSDDDTLGITVSKSSVSTSENGPSFDTFTVGPNTQPAVGNVITVIVSTEDMGEANVGDGSLTLTFTNADWTAQLVTIYGVDDDEADGDQTFNVNFMIDDDATTESAYVGLPIPSISCTNSDNDAAGMTMSKASVSATEAETPTDSFTVAPNTQPAVGEVIVVTVTSGNTDEAAVDKAILTFTNTDWQTAQTVTVTGVNDLIVDGPQTFDITIAIDPVATTADEYDADGPYTVSVTNSDNDAAGMTMSKESVSATEAETPTDSFTVAPNTQPAVGEVIVVTVTSGNTDEAAVDKATLTFTNTDWQTAQTVTVTGVNDYIVDGPKTFDITIAIDTVLTTADEYDADGPYTVSVTNSDNDAVGMTVSKATAATTEGLNTDTFTVKPDTQPAVGQEIVLTVISSDEGEATVDKAILTFTNADWQTAQTVTVAGVNDLIVDGPQTFDVTIAIDPVATTADEYDADGPYTVSVTNSDNDVTEGASDSPVDITGLTPYAGTVDGTNSYYVVGGLTQDASHIITLTGLAADLDLMVYDDDSSFSSAVCTSVNGSTADETCTVTATGTVMYIKVDGRTTGGTFTLDVAEVAASGVDLKVTINSVSGNSSTVTINYTVENLGTLDSPGDAWIDGWPNPAVPPAFGEYGDCSEFIPAADLTAGASISGTMQCAGTMITGIAYMAIDQDGDVVESNESNNITSGFEW